MTMQISTTAGNSRKREANKILENTRNPKMTEE